MRPWNIRSLCPENDGCHFQIQLDPVWDLGQPGPIVLPEEQGKPGVMLDSELIDLLIFPRPVAWPPGVSSPKKVSLMVFLSVAINTYMFPSLLENVGYFWISMIWV